MYFLMYGRQNQNPSNSAQSHTIFNLLPGSITWSTTYPETSSRQVVPHEFEMQRLYVKLSSAPGAGKSWVFTVRKNGSDTAATVTIADSAIVAEVNGISVTFAAGDYITFNCTPSGTPTVPTNGMRWSALCSSQGNKQVITTKSFGAFSATNYMGIMGNSPLSTTETLVQMVAPCAGTISNLYVDCLTAPGVGNSWVWTLRKNGSSTALTTTVSGTNIAGSDSSNSVAVSAGDLLCMQVAATGTPANGAKTYGLVFTPTNIGDSMYSMSSILSPSVSANNWNIAIGTPFSWASSGETDYGSIPGRTVLKGIYVKLNAAPSSGKSWVFTLKKNFVSQLTVNIADAATTGNSQGIVPLDIGDEISLHSAPTGTPTSPGGVGFGYCLNFPTTKWSAPFF